MGGPDTCHHCRIPKVMESQFRCLATDMCLQWLQLSGVTGLPFATFPADKPCQWRKLDSLNDHVICLVSVAVKVIKRTWSCDDLPSCCLVMEVLVPIMAIK